MKKILRIATRKSALALWQANYVKQQLLSLHPHLTFELLEITTSGDKNIDTPLYKTGGKGLFVKEIEQALLERQADLAVHSMKDVPMEIPPDLIIAAVGEREDPRDVLVTNLASSLGTLPVGAVVGTTSLRRMCQLLALRPDLQVEPLRGNVDTRVRRLDEGIYDAIVLAAAGLQRLNLGHRIVEYFPIDQFIPAAGQGALAIECRHADTYMRELVVPLNHPVTHLCVTAERALNRRLDGGCEVPIAAYATYNAECLTLRSLVGSKDGTHIIRAFGTAEAVEAENLGIRVAEDLLSQGAKEILCIDAPTP